jgi:DNA-binding IscR family transcriptional regulator
MRRDSRLSVALHVLLHVSERGRASSEALGPAMGVNPVVLRRTLAGLRDAGIVGSQRGHGGGWFVARDLETVTVAEVYEALGSPPLFSIGARDERPSCPIERAVNRAIDGALDQARALIMAQLGALTVAGVLAGARSKGSTHA